jgi:hypothetical protein
MLDQGRGMDSQGRIIGEDICITDMVQGTKKKVFENV